MPQAPLKPLPLRALAVEKPEWGGHKRTALQSITQTTAGSAFLGDEEILIIGAGIAGCSTAYWLGRAGKTALVLDRGSVNGQASGGNAGSMHVQLLSFDFGSKAEAGGTPALKTLLLQRESAHMWADLERELNGDFEIKTVGGLMMAETERELGMLREKAARERAMGIDVEVIDRAELERIAPAISPVMLGASFCPEEGKINPLKGTHGIFRGAVALGQRFRTNIEVLNISRDGAGFRIDTPRGWYRAHIVVNAAGAWASQVSRLVGRPVPVHGAPLQMIVTEAVAPAVHHLLAHVDRHLTMKQMQNGNFILGGAWTAGYDAITGYPTCLRDSLEGNVWVARRVVPSLDGVHILRSWAAMNINIDGAPIVGEMPGVPGFYNTVTSNGYTLGPIMGRITSDLITRGTTDWDIRDFTLSRF
jgi:glycine/D-amino acid oxidase-like deaminating enzyme